MPHCILNMYFHFFFSKEPLGTILWQRFEVHSRAVINDRLAYVVMF